MKESHVKINESLMDHLGEIACKKKNYVYYLKSSEMNNEKNQVKINEL